MNDNITCDGWRNSATKHAWIFLSNDERAFNRTLRVATTAAQLRKLSARYGYGDEVDFDDIFATFNSGK